MNLTTKYNGIEIKNPIIAGSSGLTNSVEKNKKIEEHGAGAIVLKSLFEEQILNEAFSESSANEHVYPEAYDYIKNYVEDKSIENYLDLIRKTKNEVKIPVIASINCNSPGSWTKFAREIETAGADALEINISNIPTDIEKKSEENEKLFFEIIEDISKEIRIPISLKMNHFSAGLANLIRTLDWTKKIKSFVLFNRFYSPDIDINNMKISASNYFSTDNDYTIPLRWIALLSEEIKAELIASTGIHTPDAVIKQILAGANATQCVSVFYKNGTEYIKFLLKGLEEWMEKNNFNSIEDFKGKLSYKNVENPSAFERIQFMKYYGGIE